MNSVEPTAQQMIAEFNQCHGHSKDDVLFVELLREDGFTDEQIANIITTMDSVCRECFDGDRYCVCCRDE